MNIVIFTHPTFMSSQSMPRYATMLEKGMSERGHKVEIWTAKPILWKWSRNLLMKKWLGYIDQYLLFPIELQTKLKGCPKGTLFVFSDHALGPWVKMIADRPHVIHCHDFLAQQSALGNIPENKVNWTGKIYQKYIRNGYRKGKNFISISEKTQEELHNFLDSTPLISEVVYNGLNQHFSSVANKNFSRIMLGEYLHINLTEGYILHVGGNQYYKNRKGVLEIYDKWRVITQKVLPLVMIGEKPTDALLKVKNESEYNASIHFVVTATDDILKQAYQGATVLLFPSLAEGFGWPIAEAMASGCPVITTNEAPMTEVGGDVALYIVKRPSDNDNAMNWAVKSAEVLTDLVEMSKLNREDLIQQGLKNAKRFDTNTALDQIESVYMRIMKKQL